MELPPAAELLLEIERRQDDVLRSLEDLDTQVELTLRHCQTHLKLVRTRHEDAA